MAYYIKGKGWFEASGLRIGSQRQMDIARARCMGFEEDRRSFTRLVIESRVAQNVLTAAFNSGLALKAKTLEASITG